MEFTVTDNANKRYAQTKMEMKHKVMNEVGTLFDIVYNAEEGKDTDYRVNVERVEPKPVKKAVEQVADKAAEVAKEGAKVVRKVTK